MNQNDLDLEMTLKIVKNFFLKINFVLKSIYVLKSAMVKIYMYGHFDQKSLTFVFSWRKTNFKAKKSRFHIRKLMNFKRKIS